MVKIWGLTLIFHAFLTHTSAQGGRDTVQCNPLAVPDHGNLSATDSNNLYSKVTYMCDSGYTIQGPPSRQCLPVPYPNTAVWVPDDVTICVQAVKQLELMEEMDALLIYDPEEDFQLRDNFNHMLDEHANDPEYIVVDEADIHKDEDGDTVSPPPWILSAINDDFQPSYDQPLLSSEVSDELCVRTEDIPERYQCTGAQTTTSVRWMLDTLHGECVMLDLCGDDDEISIMGLFHTYAECEKRCLS